MGKLKNNQNVIKNICFALLSVLFLSIILGGLYELEKYNLYNKFGNNLLLILIYYLLLLTLIAVILIKGYKLIFNFFNIWSKEIKFTKEENKRFNIFIVGLIFSMFVIDGVLEFDDIESVFLRIMIKSVLATIFLLFSVKYVDRIINKKDKND